MTARTIARSRAIKGELQGPRLAVLRAADFCIPALKSLYVHSDTFRCVRLKQGSILLGHSGHRSELISFCLDG